MSQEVGSADGVVTASRDGAILRLTLDRPARRNSLEPFDGRRTRRCSDQRRSRRFVASHPHPRRGRRLLRGRRLGRHQFRRRSGRAPATWSVASPTPPTGSSSWSHTIHLPVVCTVRGWAVGLGCNLALAADFTVAAADAVFWEPFVTRGLQPGLRRDMAAAAAGRVWRAPRRMLLLGEKVSGSRRRRLGTDSRRRRGGRSRRGRRGIAGPARRGPDGRGRAGQAGSSLRSARDIGPDDDPGAVQS